MAQPQPQPSATVQLDKIQHEWDGRQGFRQQAFMQFLLVLPLASLVRSFTETPSFYLSSDLCWLCFAFYFSTEQLSPMTMP